MITFDNYKDSQGRWHSRKYEDGILIYDIITYTPSGTSSGSSNGPRSSAYDATANNTLRAGTSNFTSVGTAFKGTATANTLNNYVSKVTVYGGAGNDNIYNGWFGGSSAIKGGSGNDTIDSYAENVTLKGGSGDDKIYTASNATVVGGNGNDLIYVRDFSGNLSKGGQVLIDGGNGNDNITVTYSKNSTILGGAGNDTINSWGNYTNHSGNKIYGGDGNDSIKSGGHRNSTAETVVGGKGDDTITTSNGTNGKDIILYSAGDGDDVITDGFSFLSWQGDFSNPKNTIYICGSSYTTLRSGNDVVVKVGNGSITLKDIGQYTGYFYDSVLNIDTLSTAISTPYFNGSDDDCDYMINLPTGLSISGNVLTASNKFTGNSINLANYSGASKINASAVTKNLNLTGNSAANSIRGGSGADTINVGAGNDTATGGNGKDIFIYSGGNDLITDYTAGQDKIKLSNATISSASLSGNNVIFTTSKGNITVQNAKNKKITVIDSSGKESSKIYSSNTGMTIKGTSLTASNDLLGNEINLTYYTSIKKVDASKLSKGVQIVGNDNSSYIKGGKEADTIRGGAGKDTIYGNAGNDKIYGGAGNDFIYGGAGNDTIVGQDGNAFIKGDDGNDIILGDKGKDTIYGGKGNDIIFGEGGNDKIFGDAGNDTLYGGKGNNTLTGGDGKDVFVYEGGKDIITDYTAGRDKIKILSGTVTKKKYKGNDVVFTIGSGSLTGTLTVKNGKGKKISVTDSTNKTTTYSRTAALFDDDNFLNDTPNLDSITEQKYSVTQIQPQNNSTLAQDFDNLITYADK